MKKWIMARLNVCRWVGLAVLITQVRHTECALSTFADVPAGTPSCADRWGAVTGLPSLKRCLGVLFLLLLLAYLISAIHCFGLGEPDGATPCHQKLQQVVCNVGWRS